MKVAVVLSGLMPTVGGGYTFQAEVFNGLSELAGCSEHEFTVFYQSAENIDQYRHDPKYGKFNFVSYQPTQQERLTRIFYPRLKWGLNRLVSAICGPVCHASLPAAHEPQNYLEEIMLDHGIEMAWFVGGGCWEAVDIPYIATVWDLMHLSDPWFPEVSAKGEWRKRDVALSVFLRRAAAIITGTQVGKREIEYFYNVPAERIHLLPHPTPGFALRAPDEGEGVLSKYGIAGKYLFYPAQFWPHKNHVVLLHVLKKLAEMGASNFSLVFVGSDQGNLNFVKQRAMELGVVEKVFFLGFVPVDDLIALYRNAFALTYVSFCGPENLPPLEAFALGCPVLASDIPGAREQLGESACLIDPAKPEQIAKMLLVLDSDAKRRESLINRGLQRASSWTSSEYIKGVFSILDKFAQIRTSWRS